MALGRRADRFEACPPLRGINRPEWSGQARGDAWVGKHSDFDDSSAPDCIAYDRERLSAWKPRNDSRRSVHQYRLEELDKSREPDRLLGNGPRSASHTGRRTLPLSPHGQKPIMERLSVVEIRPIEVAI